MLTSKIRVVVGGDFNTVLHHGARGEFLDQVLSQFNLKVLNDGDDLELSWTFCSNQGVKRKIDFILSNLTTSASNTSASHSICLGSNHTAVGVNISMPSGCSKTRKRRTL